MTESFAADGIRIICAALDRIIYGVLIPAFYNLIESMAKLQVFSDNSVQEFAKRVYSLLALFMLFKISFSFIAYIVNPDQMTDKQKGASNIIKNVIIVLILIIITPRAFSLLREAQSAILDDNILPQFILGSSDTNQSVKNEIKYFDNSLSDRKYCKDYSTTVYAKTTGDYISIMIFKGFFKPEEGRASDNVKNTGYCEISPVNTTVADFLAINYNDAKEGVKSKYEINYWIIISTIVGLAVALMLLTTCFDVAVRAIKLGFLEIISPIPIISYLNPNSGKNGMFKNWVKEVGKTWASLFIRLASIFFAVYAIQQFTGADLSHAFEENGYLVEIFVIIGALMFAKQLPKLLETLMPGLKMSGGFQINPFKKVRDEAIGGKYVTAAATGAVAGGIAAAGGAAANVQALKNNIRKNGWQEALLGKDRTFTNGKTGIAKVGAGLNSLRLAARNSVGSVAGGAMSSAGRTFLNGKDGTWHPLKNAKEGITSSSKARNSRADGWGMKDNIRDNWSTMAQQSSSTGTSNERKNEIKELQLEKENYVRDEQRYSMAMSNIESSNGGAKANLYADAFKYVPVRSEDGTITYEQQTPNNYNDWLYEIVSDEDKQYVNFESLTSSYINSGLSETDARKEAENYIDRYVANKPGLSDTVLTRKEYDNYKGIVEKRNEADVNAKKTETKITKKQEQIDSRKNKKG